MLFIKIYGLERSGTNYLEWLFKNNTPEVKVLVDETGWKHGRVPEDVDWLGMDWSDPNMLVDEKVSFAQRRRQRLGDDLQKLVRCIERDQLAYCFIAKNPYSWCVSYSRYKGLKESPVRAEPINRWCELNAHWFEFASEHPERCVFLRYEDLLDQPVRVFADLVNHFGIDFLKSNFVNCDTELSMFAGEPSGKKFDVGYYKERRYMANFTSKDLALFSTALDGELMAKLGYELKGLDSKDIPETTGSLEQITVGDQQYILPKPIGEAKLITGDHEPWLDPIYRAALATKAGAYVDVGANLGQSLLKMLRIDNARAYVGFEPQSEGAKLIQSFFELNELEHGHIFNNALSSQEGMVELYLHSSAFDQAASGTASIVERFRPSDFYSASKFVMATTGDSALADLGLDKLAMIKVDVEGGELEVLQGFDKNIEAHLPIIHFEVLNHALIMTGELLDDETIAFREARAAKLEKLLRSKGYEIYQIYRRGAFQRIDKIRPLKVLSQSDAHYLAIHSSDHDHFIANLSSLNARVVILNY